MNTSTTCYQYCLNLKDRAFLRINHNDAMVAVVYSPLCKICFVTNVKRTLTNLHPILYLSSDYRWEDMRLIINKIDFSKASV